MNQNIDIDKILIVTFTNAAASEMRERILEAIYKKLEETPEDVNLQRQITLLNKASICTIHSFCLDVIKNNFYEIDTSANFRIGDTAEIELLKNDVLEEIFEQKYLEEDKGFLKLIETYTGYRGDEKLIELILNIYQYIQSSPFPLEWLHDKVENFNIKEEQDFSETIWGKIMMNHIKEEIKECIIKLEKTKNDTLKFPELEKYTIVLEEDINHLAYVFQNMNSWDTIYRNMNEMTWRKWPIDKKVTIELKNEAKDIRDKIKKQYQNICIKYQSKEAIQDIRDMYSILKELEKMIIEFSVAFQGKKKEKNMIDFNDIEHFALNILIKKTDGKIEETEVAKKYKEKFEEIAVDEYQDSNLVQEYILNSISNQKNIFMVGDVKQSIYKFRQARPELFLEKYEKYQLKPQKNTEDGLKIQLFKNFRSRSNILEITNLVFEDIMSKELGDVEYNEEEFLNYGANYPEPEDIKESNFAGIAELHVIDLKEEKEDIYQEKEQEENEKEVEVESDENEIEEKVEDAVLEAKFVANKIKELIESEYIVYDRKKGYRKVNYKDVCILLRATSKLAPIYEKEISKLDMPVFSDSSATYLDSMEVQTIMALLKVIDNPMQDIPLVTVLRSSIGGFDDNELIQIRLTDKDSTFYEAMIKSKLSVNQRLKKKIETLLECIEKWKNEEKYLPLYELIWKIYIETGFYHYVGLLPNGNLRQANLKLLFEKAKQYEKASLKGLFNFIHFIDKVRVNSNDMGSAKLIGENDNVIRIMSIHKSKGLEFPIVFLCGTGKKFNMQDLNSPILLHQDIGFGMKYIDVEKKIEYDTLSKEAIKIVTKRENISEEMRVLYVALTRAKEKLFITGLSKDFTKAMQEKEKLLDIYKDDGAYKKKINYKLIEKYTSYLDWLELIYLYHKDTIANMIQLHTHKKEDILKECKETNTEEINLETIIQKERDKISQEEKEKLKQTIRELLEWKYEYIESSNIPTKTSVTKLKQIEEKDTDMIETVDMNDLIDNNKTEKIVEKVELTYVPKFMEENKKLTPMQKGTLLHLCVQKLDEKKEYTEDDLKTFVKKLYEKNIITEVEKDSIDIKILQKYVQSELYRELQNAKKIGKEIPFYINVPAKTIYPEADEKEKILVQGIIDLYYIDKNDNLILVDYKTDYMKPGEEIALEEKYKVQLDLYTKALEEALGRKVDKAMIYHLS